MSGIILQTPLPGGAKLEDLASGIAPAKRHGDGVPLAHRRPGRGDLDG
ncbi:hypothetical protein AB0395_04220 [Streptosporangium sp. NPDC051023]